MPKLLLIESPGKLRKLQQILGSDWIIKASMGHIRELANDGEDALGFDLGTNGVIPCRYIPRDARSKKVLAELRQAVKQADSVFIATDPDREGETIGWHLQQELKLKNPRRVTYTEITPQAVRTAIAQPRTLDQNLVAAGRARDCLDKLVGYRGSKHVVWKLNNGAKSMGRVQSAALHILCQREQEIQQFQPQDYWSVWSDYGNFKAFYRANPTKRRSPAQTADDAEGSEKAIAPETAESDRVTSQTEADRLVAIARAHPHQVLSITGKVTTQSPPPPFTTSTLQQAAGAKLKFSPDKTMKVAQSLYEAGKITYMRTDSVALSDSFCAATQQYLAQHDPQNLPTQTTRHRPPQNAQAAHEAVRPTDVNQLPGQLSNGDESALYDLIWNRTVAAQCAPARLRKTRVITQSADLHWEARGQVVEFLGYAKYWNNLSADHQLPELRQGQNLPLKQANSERKQTQPPPRYTEPKLVQTMERQGIGRPSTYAPTIKTLKERQYAVLEKGKLQATELGMDLDQALSRLLPDLIQPQFTAQMEADLDAIAQGQKNWETYLIDWNRSYFQPALEQAVRSLGTVLSASPALSPSPPHTTLPPPSKRQPTPSKIPHLTESLCPSCHAYLEQHAYTKDGKPKTMLRCSIPAHRAGKCKEVAFFESRGEFWSPKYGVLKTIVLTEK